MAYKIAVGSSDGIHVDLKFGEVTKFLIYEVDDTFRLLEERYISLSEVEKNCAVDNGSQCNGSIGCGEGSHGAGCGGGGNGCNGGADVMSKVSLIADCRCIVCKKIGFQAQKQFEKKAISVFDVECEIEEALEKITFYYGKIDKHEAFRK